MDASGGGVTVTVTRPSFPSLVATITAEPWSTAVRSPACVTVAMIAASLRHVTFLPVSAFPLASRVRAVSTNESSAARDGFTGVTTTLDTGVGPASFLPHADADSSIAAITSGFMKRRIPIW